MYYNVLNPLVNIFIFASTLYTPRVINEPAFIFLIFFTWILNLREVFLRHRFPGDSCNIPQGPHGITGLHRCVAQRHAL